ncbi:MAG: DUF1207 domain-containing protein [Ignavibacteria bacterium]|nr:DUF1207 domain-containing protein [Ignavibacteria bacterium]
MKAKTLLLILLFLITSEGISANSLNQLSFFYLKDSKAQRSTEDRISTSILRDFMANMSEKDSVYFFETNNLYVPVEAGIIEAKNGATKFLNNDYLTLNIGAAFDLVGLKTNKNTYSFGVEFFTFSNLRTEDNFKFPVDAIDYLFGVTFNLKRKLTQKNTLTSRLRISHISSHFEDGHQYENTDTIFTPVVFSKEFLELNVMSDYLFTKDLSLKSMVGVNYIFSRIPNEISPVSGQLGLELRYYFTDFFSVYLSNENNLATVNSSTNLNESFESGISFGKRNSRSLLLYFDYYDGQDYKGQYYGGYLNYTGLGMRFKF